MKLAWATEPASFRLLSFVLSLLLLAFYLPASTWTGNEENYFQLAYRRIAPDAFSPWSSVFDHANARVVAETLYGKLIELLGYESAHLVARVGTAALYAAGLAVMFASVRLSLVESVTVVLTFHLLGEQILGGEWLFDGTEPKTIAYALIFFAIGAANLGRWRAVVLTCGGATWIHFLVGGFWSLALGLCAVWQLRPDWRAVARLVGAYVLMIAPLLAIIVHDQFATVSSLPLPHVDDVVPKVAEIYAWRNAHHVSPFVNPAIFPHWRRGFVALGVAIVAFAILWRRRPPGALLLVLAGVGLAELVLAVVISYLDQDRLAMAKLYLFRPSSVTLLLLVSAAVIAIRRAASPRFRAWFTGAPVLVLATLQALQLIHPRDRLRAGNAPTLPHEAGLIAAIRASSSEGEIVVLDPELDPTLGGIRLSRLIDRPTVVALKFVPTAPQDIQRWYLLLRWRERLFEDGCAGGTHAVPVKLIITSSPGAMERVANCGTVIWRRDDMAVVDRASVPAGSADSP